MNLMFITNDVDIAKEAEKAGIDRIFIDLERLGKIERQGHLDTHIAEHNIEDIANIKKVLKQSKILTRINPINPNTKEEIEKVIELGTDIIMLPMFKTVEEVQEFVDYVDGRVTTCLLLETSQALVRIEEIVKVKGIDEIHIGLNDLHLSLGLDFMFEILSSGMLDYLSKIINSNNIKFGFGGIAQIGEGELPAEIIIREHARLNSSMVILSRSFHKRAKNIDELRENINLKEAVNKVRKEYENCKLYTQIKFDLNRQKLKEIVYQKISQR